MPTILRIYSNHQSNLVLCDVIEFTCRQFFIMHREPFILQVSVCVSDCLKVCLHVTSPISCPSKSPSTFNCQWRGTCWQENWVTKSFCIVVRFHSSTPIPIPILTPIPMKWRKAPLGLIPMVIPMVIPMDSYYKKYLNSSLSVPISVPNWVQ